MDRNITPTERLGEPERDHVPLSGLVLGSASHLQDTAAQPQPHVSSEASRGLGQALKSNAASLSDEPILGVSDEEATVDTLATAAFSDETETDIGHFGTFSSEIQLDTLLTHSSLGPSSNHDYFRTLSGIFAHLARDGLAKQPHNLNAWSVTQSLTASVPQRRSHVSGTLDCMVLPDDHTAMTLFNQFFITIALTMPYFSRPALLREYTRLRGGRCQDFDRVHRALFNMIWAHGSSSLEAVNPEVYYRRAVGLLDSLTIRRTSQEMGEFNVRNG